MTSRYKKRINADAAADDDNNTQTQTLSSLTDFSLHVCSWFYAVSVHTI
jgi:hypothetical protein